MKTLISQVTLFVVCILYALNVAAQNKTIDSLKQVLLIQKEDTSKVNTLLDIRRAFTQINDYTRGLQYANDALLLAKKINSEKKQASAYGSIGLIYFYDLKKYTEARENILKSHAIRTKLGDRKYEAFEYFLIAQTYQEQFNNSEALKYLYLFLRSAHETGDKANEADALQMIGATFHNQKDNIEALKNYRESLKIREGINSKGGIAQSLKSIADIYSSQGDHTKAIQNLLAALKIVKEPGFKGPKWLLPYTYSGLGSTYENQGDSATAAGNKGVAATKYNEALTAKLTALELWRKLDGKEALAETYTDLGNIYRKQNKLPIAKNYLEKGLRESLTLGTVDNLQLTYSHLAKLDSMQGDYKQAYQHYKLSTIYQDSLTNQAKTRNLLEVKSRYELEKKDAVAKAEQEKRDLLEQRAKNKQVYVIASLGLLVLVFVLIAFIQWRNNQQKQKTNALLLQQKDTIEKTLNDLKSTQTQLVQKEKMASLGELTAGIAHEIQNPLNFVNNFSEISADMVNELAEERQKPQPDISLETDLLTDLRDNLHKILHHGQRASNIVRGMLEHSRNSTGDVQPTDINALADEFLRLAYHGQRAKDPNFNCELVTHFDPAIGKVNVMTQEIGRVLLNLFTNAFYALWQRQQQAEPDYRPRMTVSTLQTKTVVEIQVADNGTGISDSVIAKIFQPFFTTKPTGEGTGLGLSLSYDIITKGHGGTLSVTSQEGEGTEFSIQLPTAG